MREWRESTWWWLACVAAALVAEIIYATNDQYGNLQGRAFGLLIVVSICFAIYRALRRPDRD